MAIQDTGRKTMKWVTTLKAISYSLVFILFIAIPAHSGWQLYDDFNSGTTIDASKWSIDNSSAVISIEGGELKFVHQEGFAEDSSWLTMIDRPQSIAGIRATMRVESCTGDVRGRIGGIIGQVGENVVWSTVRIRPTLGRIETSAALLTPSYDYISDIFFGAFKYNWNEPFDITYQNFTVEWLFSPRATSARTDAFGDIIFEYDAPLSPTADHFRAIGTRSNTGEGPCEVYFDNVYVFRKASVTAPHLLLLEE
jgi:hypothetical protein